MAYMDILHPAKVSFKQTIPVLTVHLHRAWKASIIRPVPKKPGSKDLNDFCPVALAPVLAKCMESDVSKHLTSSIAQQLDPLQFAYKTHSGTEDATLTMVNMITSHLQRTNTYIQISFDDFSLAFNMMQIHVLCKSF